MCDIGRFDYHWIEGDDRLQRPLMRDQHGVARPVSWPELLSKLRDRFASAGTSNPEGVRFLLSAHASHEELFLFRRLAGELIGDAAAAIAVSWRYRPKSQPGGTAFKVPAVDAPNVNGARMLGLAPGTPGEETREADISALRQAGENRRVTALYVVE